MEIKLRALHFSMRVAWVVFNLTSHDRPEGAARTEA